MSFLRRQCDEIYSDPALHAFGVTLSLLELLCVIRLVQVRADRMLARGGEALCWPMLPGCARLRVLDQSALRAVLALCALSSLVAAFLFLRKKCHALPLLAATELIKLSIVAQDFRLRQNQFYMMAFVVAAFLLLPSRRLILRVLIVLFYFWAGILKLNQEWLSGSALYAPTFVPRGPLLVAAAYYVVALELVIVWGLLLRRRYPIIFWITLGQVVLFELFSWPVVGFFYPLLMLGLLTLFVLPPRQADSIVASESTVAPTTASFWVTIAGPAFLAFFCALQLLPHAFPGDTAITGEGRLFALHMFDAKVECESTLTLHNGSAPAQIIDLRPGLPIRTACDPATVHARALTMCARHPDPPYIVDVHLASRRSSAPALHTVVDIKDYCHHRPVYRWWTHNDWIRTE